MKRYILLTLLIACNTLVALAQGSIKGKILDKHTKGALEFINITVKKAGEDKIIGASISDIEGNYFITDLPLGSYTLTASFIGYKEYQQRVTLTDQNKHITLSNIFLSEDSKQLQEVVVTAQASQMKLEVDRKTFNVDQQIMNTGGSASDVLENIPSVEVDNEGNISLRGNSSVEVWINGRNAGMNGDNRGDVLQQLPAATIERIEVIDNPSAKFSAEGSAGIINIVLKRNRKAGYYGSAEIGANSQGGMNGSFNINYNSSLIDAYVGLGYRKRKNEGGSKSEQIFHHSNRYQRYQAAHKRNGDGQSARAGITWHASPKDDFSFNGMVLMGNRNEKRYNPYHFGTLGNPFDTSILFRENNGYGDMQMVNGGLAYRHMFTDKHTLDISLEYDNWRMNRDNVYQDSTVYFDVNGNIDPLQPTKESYEHRPLKINNKSWEFKIDYENQLSKTLKLQAGYQAELFKENTPQESYIDLLHWNGEDKREATDRFNRFIYKNNIHALYTTLSYNEGKFGVMAGLRAEYWKVFTESYTWQQEHNPSLRAEPFKKDYFELFPSVFLSYQLTPNDQLQLNYTRRLRRPWGGELNTFQNISDATLITMGNAELTPEFSNSFSFNYLKTWKKHSLLISAYYRPTTDVMQKITYRNPNDGMLYQTSFNLAKSQAAGLELTAKNKLSRIIDLNTSVNLYHYNLNGFTHEIEGQTITGEPNSQFTWNARTQLSLMLPYEISFQATGNFRSRQSIAQGYTKATGGIDLGLRKSFANRKWVLSFNVRDLLNSQKQKMVMNTPSFMRYQESWRSGRTARITLTWNFGSSTKRKDKNRSNETVDEDFGNQGYGDF